MATNEEGAEFFSRDQSEASFTFYETQGSNQNVLELHLIPIVNHPHHTHINL